MKKISQFKGQATQRTGQPRCLNAIRRTLSILIAPDAVAELRAPDTPNGNFSGVFDDVSKLAAAAARLSAEVPKVFVSLNPLKKNYGSLIRNIGVTKRKTATDEDVERRCWFPVDFDPVRATSVPSTDAEHAAALSKARECREWLREQGWPEPVKADSGNGAHLLYRIELPNDDGSRDLVQRCLEALAIRFSDSVVQVDTAVFDASRVWRLYGTLNRKGDATEERPYRLSKLLEVPEEMRVVGEAQLQKLASGAPTATATKGKFDVAGWIKKHDLDVVGEADWKKSGHKWILKCSWNPEHTNNSAYILQFPDGGVDAGCLHDGCAGKKWPDLRALYEPPDAQSTGKARSQTDVMLEIVGDVELFHTAEGEGYVTVPVGTHYENFSVQSSDFRKWLQHRYFVKVGRAPRPAVIPEAVAHFDARARFDSPEFNLSVRVAACGDKTYIDLGNRDWQVIEISGDGWQVISKPPVKFRRPAGMLALPVPVKGGSIDELWRFVNVGSTDDRMLYVACLLAAFRARGPYPIPTLYGSGGNGKTTAVNVYRSLVDPKSSGVCAAPKDIHDLVIAASSSWLLSFDNLSHLQPWLSDAICRLSTGAGFSTRKLYTDAEEKLFYGQRPLILNGIDELATRSDLIDRSVFIYLPEIPDGARQDEEELWNKFESARPRILGALLDALVVGHRNVGTVKLPEKPRMADFAKWVAAAESALPWAKGAFLRAYTKNRQHANEIALEASPVAHLMREMANGEPWQGTSTDLLAVLRGMVLDTEALKQRNFPKTGTVLSGMLRRLKPNLAKVGVRVEFGKNGNRWIRIEKIETSKS